MSSWQAVAFDLDDTLYPERAYVLGGLRAVATWAESELGPPAGETYAELSGLFREGVRGDTFDRWLASHGFAPSLVAEMVLVYREHRPSLEPYDGVPALLESLRGSCRLGLLTDGYLAVQQRKLDALGMAGLFDAIVFSDRWGRAAWKPSTRPFLELLEQLEAEPAGAVYVADNPAKDFLGPRRIGMHSVRILHSDGLYARERPPTSEHAADACVTSVAELAALLRGDRSPS